MLQLTNDFFIISSKKNSKNKNSVNYERNYIFKYQSFKIYLDIQFNTVGYTKKNMKPIVNFGYSVDIEQWNNRLQLFEPLIDFNTQNGLSTKRYITCPTVRSIILKFIEYNVRRYLNYFNPHILIRASLSDEELKLNRYLLIDNIIMGYTYNKKILKNKESLLLILSLFQNADNNKHNTLVYVKKKKYLKYFDNIIKV